jgi:hypothetical protein
MSAFTQKFPINRRAVASALELLPDIPLLLTEAYYTKLDDPHPLGIGWNKVESVRGWMKAASMIQDIPRSRGGGGELTWFGALLRESDLDLNRPWTWWAIHLHLCFNPEATVYHLLFSYCTESTFRREDALQVIAPRAAGLAIASVNSELDGILRSFGKGEKLSTLGVLVRQDDQTLVRGRPENLPIGLIAYAAYLLREHEHANAPSMALRTIVGPPGGMNSLMGLPEQVVREALRALNRTLGDAGFYFAETAGLDSLTFGGLQSREILTRVAMREMRDVVAY